MLRTVLRPCPEDGIPVGQRGVVGFRALPLLPGVPMLGTCVPA